MAPIVEESKCVERLPIPTVQCHWHDHQYDFFAETLLLVVTANLRHHDAIIFICRWLFSRIVLLLCSFRLAGELFVK